MVADSYRMEIESRMAERLAIFIGQCDWCGEKTNKWEVDHIIPQEIFRKFPMIGNADVDANRWALCLYCHRERKDEVDAPLVQWLLGVRILATDVRFARTTPEELFWNEFCKWVKRARLILPASRLDPILIWPNGYQWKIWRMVVKARYREWNKDADSFSMYRQAYP